MVLNREVSNCWVANRRVRLVRWLRIESGALHPPRGMVGRPHAAHRPGRRQLGDRRHGLLDRRGTILLVQPQQVHALDPQPLQDPDHRLRPGMSVVPTIYTSR